MFLRLLSRFHSVAGVAALFTLLAAAPRAALAHAVLVASHPRANSVIYGSSLHVALRFNSRVDGPRCVLSLVAVDGQSRSLQLAPQAAPDQIAADAAGLHKGIYSLRWQALAADGHLTRGAIPFRVE